MKFSLHKSLEILENTPAVISALLNNLTDEWTTTNEEDNTWNPMEVVAHLIVCEKTDWLPRVKIILSHLEDKTFVSINMTAHFDIAKSNSMKDLIKEFKQLRESGIKEIKAFNLQEADLRKIAIHPTLGEVNLQHLFATWVVHDLTHIAQISRVIAKQNKENVGAFAPFLNILK